WLRVSATGGEHGHRRGAHRTTLSLAEPLRRASNRHHPPRASRPRHRPERGPVVCQNPVAKTGRWPSGVRAKGAMSLVLALLGALRASLRTCPDLAPENVALRQQLVLLRRRSKQRNRPGEDVLRAVEIRPCSPDAISNARRVAELNC